MRLPFFLREVISMKLVNPNMPARGLTIQLSMPLRMSVFN